MPQLSRLGALSVTAGSGPGQRRYLAGVPEQPAAAKGMRSLPGAGQDASGRIRAQAVLPPEIGHLTSLKELRLDGNQLTELASEVGAAAACGRGAAAGLDPLA